MSEQEEKEINARVIEEYRANAGVVGDEFADLNLLLLYTTGAKSGQLRINPLECMEDGERYVVFASYAGEPRHPDWYYNLLANPNVTVEYKTETFEAVAHMAEEPERSELYARMEGISEGFKDYKHTANRVIPVVVLERK
ncbi:MAG: nitroreductase family deazaflavin-dependent oxidoreductase [Chloroflexi bacterium]|nr:MAG: nitroreductase family deazaflavin-dependent oxidoreductase [Chloroflexota bacterium]MBL1195890.1 nitroreductase family deazaflavin-dependent oxidoreductase [Chloroflexota bacterium]NOH13183.1 nitroreductase family deazaflavin-dependent oxidoreductase [Chloroflexota bacterium]